MRKRCSWLWLLTLAWVLWPVSHAVADEDAEEQARRHFDRGVELVDQGSFEQAAAEFTRAYELSPSADALWKLAQTYVALDRPLEALEALEQYDRDGGAALEAERRAELDQLLSRLGARVGRLTIVVQPDGALVRVDGEPLGSAPLAADVRLRAGEHQISASHADFKERTSKVMVLGGERVSVELLLEPAQPTRSAGGKLLVQCPVPGVRVVLNGKPIGQTPRFGPLPVPPGHYEISFARPGYAMASKRVEVTGEQTATVSCAARLVRPLSPDVAGTVSLTVSEPDAKVVVDGLAWPADGRLPAGPHVMSVSKYGFERVKVDFSLKAGEERQLNIGLRSLRGDDVSYADTGPSAGRVMAYVTGAVGLALGGVCFGLAIWNDGRFDDWTTEHEALEQARAAGTPEAELAGRQTANDELQEDIETIDGVTIGLGVAGGALLGTGIILLLASSSSDEQQSAWLIGPQPGGGYVGWATTW